MMTGSPSGDEDCLYLNVFVPKVNTLWKRDQRFVTSPSFGGSYKVADLRLWPVLRRSKLQACYRWCFSFMEERFMKVLVPSIVRIILWTMTLFSSQLIIDSGLSVSLCSIRFASCKTVLLLTKLKGIAAGWIFEIGNGTIQASWIQMMGWSAEIWD